LAEQQNLAVWQSQVMDEMTGQCEKDFVKTYVPKPNGSLNTRLIVVVVKSGKVLVRECFQLIEIGKDWSA
jgi:hypothetical protein